MPESQTAPPRSTVLVVDDEAGPRESLRMILAPHHRVLQAESGERALEVLRREPVALATIDLLMPGMLGLELVHAVRREFPDVEIIVITGCGSVESAAEGLRCGIADYIQKPFDIVQVTASVARALGRHQARSRLTEFLEELGHLVGPERGTDSILEDLQRSRGLRAELGELLDSCGEAAAGLEAPHSLEFLEVLAETIEARDPCMRGHARRVALYAGLLAERLGLGSEEQEQVRLAAFLHDLGKVGVRPVEPMLRVDGLDADERKLIEQHPEVGARLLQPLGLPASVSQAIRHHHEWWDGTGYPAGLAGDSIPLHARIIGVVDAFDAMRCERRYRDALDHRRVIGELEAFSAIQFDPHLVKEFLSILESADPDLELLAAAVGQTPERRTRAAG